MDRRGKKPYVEAAIPLYSDAHHPLDNHHQQQHRQWYQHGLAKQRGGASSSTGTREVTKTGLIPSTKPTNEVPLPENNYVPVQHSPPPTETLREYFMRSIEKEKERGMRSHGSARGNSDGDDTASPPHIARQRKAIMSADRESEGTSGSQPTGPQDEELRRLKERHPSIFYCGPNTAASMTTTRAEASAVPLPAGNDVDNDTERTRVGSFFSVGSWMPGMISGSRNDRMQECVSSTAHRRQQRGDSGGTGVFSDDEDDEDGGREARHPSSSSSARYDGSHPQSQAHLDEPHLTASPPLYHAAAFIASFVLWPFQSFFIFLIWAVTRPQQVLDWFFSLFLRPFRSPRAFLAAIVLFGLLAPLLATSEHQIRREPATSPLLPLQQHQHQQHNQNRLQLSGIILEQLRAEQPRSGEKDDREEQDEGIHAQVAGSGHDQPDASSLPSREGVVIDKRVDPFESLDDIVESIQPILCDTTAEALEQPTASQSQQRFSVRHLPKLCHDQFFHSVQSIFTPSRWQSIVSLAMESNQQHAPQHALTEDGWIFEGGTASELFEFDRPVLLGHIVIGLPPASGNDLSTVLQHDNSPQHLACMPRGIQLDAIANGGATMTSLLEASLDFSPLSDGEFSLPPQCNEKFCQLAISSPINVPYTTISLTIHSNNGAGATCVQGLRFMEKPQDS